MQSHIELKVREEVLYCEALALGLDKGDEIVKRRLAQKMEFLAEGASINSDPSPDTLKAWFKDNLQRFSLPPRASFRHLYFSPDQRGEHAREDAVHVMAQLAGKPGNWEGAAALADPFMDQDYYTNRSADDLAKLFGLNFAQDIAGLKPGAWQGPVESGYGWHLVFIDTFVPGRVPAFEEIEPEIKAEWIEDRRLQAKRKAYEAMRSALSGRDSGKSATMKTLRTTIRRRPPGGTSMTYVLGSLPTGGSSTDCQNRHTVIEPTPPSLLKQWWQEQPSLLRQRWKELSWAAALGWCARRVAGGVWIYRGMPMICHQQAAHT